MSGDHEGSAFELTIRLVNGDRFPVSLPAAGDGCCTVRQVKEAIARLSEGGNANALPVEQQRLIYKGRILDDDNKSMQEFGIASGSTLFLVKKATAAEVARVTAPLPTTNTAASATASNASSSATSPPGASGGRDNFMGQLLQQASHSTRSGGTDSGSGTNMFGGMPMPTREQQQQLLNSPLMQGLASQPELLARLLRIQLESNPQLQSLLEENPQLRHMMEDPATINQLAEMMRHPGAMDQALRQQDLALSQLENMPGGFAALSSMYSNIQEPLQDSMTGSGGNNDSSATANSNVTSNDEGATGTAMPNPWGSSNRRSSNNSTSGAAATASPWGAAAAGSGTANFPFAFPAIPPPPRQPASQEQPSASAPAASGTERNPWAHLSSSNATDPTTSNTNEASNTGPGSASAASSAQGDLFSSLLGRAAGGGSGQPSLPPGAGFGPGGFSPDMILNLLDDPLFSQMIETAVRQNPDQFRMALQQQDPAFQQMFGNDREAGNQFVQSMLNPNMLRTVLRLQQQQQTGSSATAAGANAAASVNSQPQMPPFDFSRLFSGAGIGGSGGSASAGGGGLDWSALLRQSSQFQQQTGQRQQHAAPEVRYANQLRQLVDMGFDSRPQNLTALERAHGNLNRAVDMLLSGDVPAPPRSAVSEATEAQQQQQPLQEQQAAAEGGADAAEDTNGTTVRQRRGAANEGNGGSDSTNVGGDGYQNEGAGGTSPPDDAADKKND